MQVAVHQRLGVGHKLEFQLGHRQMEHLVAVELFLHKLGVGRENIVLMFYVVIRLHEHQVFGNLAQLGRDKALDQILFRLVLHNHIAGHQQSVDHKSGNVVGKFGEGLMFHQRVAHELVFAQVLHAAGRHDGVIEVNLGHHARGVLVLQLEDFRFDAVAVHRDVHLIRNAERLAGVFDDDRMAFTIPHAVDVVQVAVADFLGLDGSLIPRNFRHLFQGIFDDVLCFHQEIVIEF